MTPLPEQAALYAAERGSECNDLLGHAAEARWYVLANDNTATLCADEADARAMAIQYSAAHPSLAPYRAALLGDVAAERERLMQVVRDCPNWIGPHAKRELLMAMMGGPNAELTGRRGG